MVAAHHLSPYWSTASAAQEAQGAAEREQRTLQSLQKQRKHMAHAAETLRAESEALAAEVRLITKERDGLAEELGDTQTRLHKAHQAVEDAERANKDLLREHRDSAKLMADVQRLTQERNAARNAADRATRKAEAVERQLQEVGGRVASVETVSGSGLPTCVPALRRSAIVCAVRRLSDVVECAGGVMVQETTRLVTELAATRKRMNTCEEERDAAKQRLEGAQLELREALTTVRGCRGRCVVCYVVTMPGCGTCANSAPLSDKTVLPLLLPPCRSSASGVTGAPLRRSRRLMRHTKPTRCVRSWTWRGERLASPRRTRAPPQTTARRWCALTAALHGC